MPTETPTVAATEDPVTAELQRRWDDNLPHQPEMGARIIARYAEPHRHYHSGAHLLAVLQRIDEFATGQDLFLVRLGAFFHDAVYAIPVGQVTNEEASARLSRRELSKAGLEQEDLNEVARLVKITADHVPGSRDPEGGLLCDADLAVLGGSPEEYAAYVEQVRQEYASVPRERFAAGRLEIMGALAGAELYRTTKGRLLAEQARTNIEAECRALADELGVEWSLEVE